MIRPSARQKLPNHFVQLTNFVSEQTNSAVCRVSAGGMLVRVRVCLSQEESVSATVSSVAEVKNWKGILITLFETAAIVENELGAMTKAAKTTIPRPDNMCKRYCAAYKYEWIERFFVRAQWILISGESDFLEEPRTCFFLPSNSAARSNS